jgi:hypothetical protein
MLLRRLSIMNIFGLMELKNEKKFDLKAIIHLRTFLHRLHIVALTIMLCC